MILPVQIGSAMRLLLLFLLTSCSIFFGSDSPKSAKGKEYKIKFDQGNWVLKKDDRSDYVYENKSDGRILLSNSFCEEFQDQPLDHLALKTFRTINSFKASKKDYTTFHNREAYRVSGSGIVDGVKVNLNLLNTRRNNCYFDFLSIDPLSANKDNAFETFLSSVEFK
jgi:hypothetical protein